MKVVHHTVSKRKAQPAKLRTSNAVRIPFSVAGIVAVSVCPALLVIDITSGMHAMIGVIYVLLLTLLAQERRTLVALFAAVAVLSLAVDLRVFYGQPGTELAVADKITALIALPLLAAALIHQRTAQLKTAKRKPVCNIRIVQPLSERVAMHGEMNPVFKHMRRSKSPMDEYTRELIWFMYMKSAKN